MTKVSVILPIYNVSQYLRECLDSVARQTLKDIEIICVNDGSTDCSLEIVEEYAENDSRFVILDGPNGGYGKAMNRGLERARGEYVGIVEPDDYVALTMFEDLYQIAVKQNLDWVKADFYRFVREKNRDMNLKYISLDSTHTQYNELLCPCREPNLIRFVMNTWSGIYKREFLEEYQIRHNETPGASFQDNGFFFQTMIYAKRAMILDQPYYRNRRDNPNSSVKSKEKVYCSNIEYDYIRDILKRDPEVWERFKAMYSWKKFHNYLFTIKRIDGQFREEYIERAGAEFKRAFQQGDFSKEIFTVLEWEKLSLLMDRPGAFYEKYAKMEERNGVRSSKSSAQCELEAIKSSTTYKVGKLIMALPCAAKRKILARK